MGTKFSSHKRRSFHHVSHIGLVAELSISGLCHHQELVITSTRRAKLTNTELLRINMHLAVVVTVLSLAYKGHASPTYADLIPNGYSVPNPEPQGGVWAGVGHAKAGGGGERNPFGVDFAAEGHEWTKALCEKDSDGDGRSNGEELGDPECVWVNRSRWTCTLSSWYCR